MLDGKAFAQIFLAVIQSLIQALAAAPPVNLPQQAVGVEPPARRTRNPSGASASDRSADGGGQRSTEDPVGQAPGGEVLNSSTYRAKAQ